VIAAPIGLIAFLASWLIPRLELRRGVGAAQSGPNESGTDGQAPQPPGGLSEPLAPQDTHL